MRCGHDFIRSPKPPSNPAAATVFAMNFPFPCLLLPLSAVLQILAGAEGFEPPSPVLETGSLAVELTPLLLTKLLLLFRPFARLAEHARSFASLRMTAGGSRFAHARKTPSLHLFVRGVLAATPAKLAHLQPVRRRLPVLRGRIVPLLAHRALHADNFPWHPSLPVRARGFAPCRRGEARPYTLLNNLRNGACAYRVPAFADGEPQAL